MVRQKILQQQIIKQNIKPAGENNGNYCGCPPRSLWMTTMKYRSKAAPFISDLLKQRMMMGDYLHLKIAFSLFPQHELGMKSSIKCVVKHMYGRKLMAGRTNTIRKMQCSSLHAAWEAVSFSSVYSTMFRVGFWYFYKLVVHGFEGWSSLSILTEVTLFFYAFLFLFQYVQVSVRCFSIAHNNLSL